MNRQSTNRPIVWVMLVACMTLLFAAVLVRSGRAEDGADAALRAAWQATERAGSYDFSTELTETRYPAARLTSVGRSPQTNWLYLEGSADRRSGILALGVWQDPATLDNNADFELQVDGMRASARTPGGTWQPIDDISAAFAPSGDAAAFLAAAKNVRPLGTETRDLPDGRRLSYERYAFMLDGEQYAEQMRAALQKQMADAGELPAGMTLSANDIYHSVFAEGEAWIDANGLPLRMTIAMQFPQDNRGERRTVEVKTDFTAYHDAGAVSRIRLANDVQGWLVQVGAGATAALIDAGDVLRDAAPTLAVSASMVGLLALGFVAQRRKPKLVQTTFATVLSAQMAFAPLASIADGRMFERLLDRYPAMQPEAAPDPADQLAALEMQPAADWNRPLADRITQGQQLAALDIDARVPTADVDSDGDGLSDAAEAAHCKQPTLPFNDPANIDYPACSNPSDADTDNDGLTDGEEYLYLGTYPNAVDSDNDGIPDGHEVRGFLSRGVRQYSNPLAPDTDGDLHLDGVECPELQEATTWNASLACRNSDPATDADILVWDDDGDGVPSRLDLSPLGTLAPSGGFFDNVTPLDLTLNNLSVGEPTLVDIQLRPEIDRHLTLAMNYLDWPTGDSEGQIQRLNDTTFGSTSPNTPLDSPAHNGDMRVTPMLEMSLPGDTLDLPRRPAEVDTQITDVGRIMAQVTAAPFGLLTLLTVDTLVAGAGTLRIGTGSCDEPVNVVYSSSITPNTTRTLSLAFPFVVSGAYVMQVETTATTYCRAITPLVEGQTSRTLRFQSQGTPLGAVYMETSGSSDTAINFYNMSQTYDAAIYSGSCQSVTFPPIFEGATNAFGLISGKVLSEIADGEHALFLSQGDQTIGCLVLPNVVNGTLSGRTTVSPAIDQAALEAYQITVNEEVDGSLTALIPLSLVIDETTGERTAFSGRMFFQRSGGSGALNADVRLIWLISALVDRCPDNDCTIGQTDLMQVIQAYRHEGWFVTGLRVLEDQGVDVAVVYEDPTTDIASDGMTGAQLVNRNLEVDDNLWALARGLQATFLPGADFDTNGVRDYKVTDFEGYFDSDAFSSQTRFGLRADALNVETYQFNHEAELEPLFNGGINDILTGAFGDGVFDVTDLANNPTTTIWPTVLFATEQKGRSVDLDARVLDAAANLVTVNNNAVSVDMNVTKVKPTVFATLSWKPFKYADGAWQPASADEYIERMAGIIKGGSAFRASNEEEAFDVAGKLLLAQAAYLALYVGRANAVEYADSLAVEFDTSDVVDLDELDDAMSGASDQAAGFASLIAVYAGDIAEQIDFERELFARMKATGSPQQLIDALEFGTTKAIGRSITGQATEINRSFLRKAAKLRAGDGFYRLRGGGGLAAAGAIVFSGIAGAFFDPESDNSAERATAITLSSIGFAAEVIGTIETYQEFVAFKAANPNAKLGAFAKSLQASRAAKIAGIIGIVIAVGLAVGAFIYAWASSGIAIFSAEFNQLFANTIASLILTAIFVALATTGVGLVIVIVVALIDGIIGLFCGIFPPDDDNDIANGVCKGISGWLTDGIAFLIYDYTPITTFSDPDRLVPNLNMFLANPSAGFTRSASLTINMGILNTLGLNSADGLLSGLYAWQFNEDNLRDATFAYGVSTVAVEDENFMLHNLLRLEMGQHPSEWQAGGDDTFSINRTFDGNVTLPDEPGINLPLSAYSVEASVVPAQECAMIPNIIPPWTPPAIPVCWVRSSGRSIYTNLGLKIDVFPPTLDSFYTLSEKDGGYALAWGQNGELTFPRLIDADGDGVVYTFDPNDNLFDSDNDRVSDLRELQLGTTLTAADSDNDNLTDYEELQIGSNPLLADSDGDGINDGDEVNGWTLTYNIAGATTRTWPNLLLADEDGDGRIDRREKAIGGNPRVASAEDALSYETELIETRSPLLLLRMDEQLGATAFVDSAGRQTALTATCSDTRCPVAGHLGYVGGATSFGGDDVLTLGRKFPAANELTNNFTVAAWIYPTSVSGIQRILGTSRRLANDGYAFGLVGDELRMTFYFRKDFDSTGADIQPNTWTHVAATATQTGSGTDVRFYINGVQAGGAVTSGWTGANPDDNDDLMVGAIFSPYTVPENTKPEDVPYTTEEHFNGLLDEVAIYDYVLTAGQLAELRDARYNLNDGVVERSDSVTFNATLTNQLLGRTTEGLLQTQLPPVVSGAPNDRNFLLSRNDGTPANTLTDSIAMTVNANAPGGEYAIIQNVGAIIDEPQVAVNQLPAQVFQNESVSYYDGVAGRLLFSDSSYRLDSGNFTLATWVNPTSVSGTRAIMGYDAGEPHGYPSLLIVNGRLRFGFGNGTSWVEDTTVNQHILANRWTHVAVSYSRSTRVGTLFINGVAVGDNFAFTSNPTSTSQRFEIGRGTSLFTVDFNAAEVRCENDYDGPHYDLVYSDASGSGNLWSQAFIDDVEDTEQRHVANMAAPKKFREYAVLTMCENDYDDDDHDTCDSDDDTMGVLVFFYWQAGTSVTNRTFSTTPSDPQCVWYNHYDDWIEADYTTSVYSLPFQGSIKDTRIIKSTLTAAQITDLFQSNELIARFKLNDRPGTTVFDDEIAASVGTCSDTSCPLSGVTGRENVAVQFDGLNDYIRADNVSALAAAAANGSSKQLSFGGWFKPDDVFNPAESEPYIMAFNDAAGGNRLLVGLIADGNAAFKVRFFDGSDTVTTNTFARGVWNHILVSIDYNSTSNNGKLYVNGLLQNTFSTTVKPDAAGRFSIGMEWDSNTPTDFYKGAADEIAIYKKTFPTSNDAFEALHDVPAYSERLDYADRWIHVDSFFQVNNCQPFCTKRITVDGQPSVAMDIGVAFDVPIPDGDVEIEYRFNQFLAGSFIIPADVTEGTFNWSDEFDQDGFTYRVYSRQSSDQATLDWLAERPHADRGQIGSALAFGPETIGSVNSFEVNNDYPAMKGFIPEYTVAAWVRPRDLTASGQDVFRPILGTFDNGSNGQFFFGFKNGRLYVTARTLSGTREVIAPQEVPADVWSHVAVRFASNDLTLFVNGSPVQSFDNFGSSYERLHSEPTIGKGWIYNVNSGQVDGVGKYVGLIDDIQAYNKPLNNEEIAKLYNFQVAWQDERSEQPLLIDTETPTAQVENIPYFIGPAGQVVAITAKDDRAPTTAFLRVRKDEFFTFVSEEIISAPRCDDTDGGVVFCPTFVPPLQGLYYLDAIVYDAVGNSSGYTGGQYVVVDDSLPGSFYPSDLPNAPYRPLPDPAEGGVWTVPITGTAIDESIGDNYLQTQSLQFAGSGIANIAVELIDRNGVSVGDPAIQYPTRTDTILEVLFTDFNVTEWALDYRIRADNPSGTYDVYVTYSDRVGNSSRTLYDTIQLDTTSPAATVTGFGVGGRGAAEAATTPYILNGATQMTGAVTEKPTTVAAQEQVAGVGSVQVALTPLQANAVPSVRDPLSPAVRFFLPLDRSQTLSTTVDNSFSDIVAGLTLTCSGERCPQSGSTSPSGRAVLFDGVNDALTRANVASVNGLSNNFTVAAWIKPASLSGAQRIVGAARTNSNNGWSFGIFNNQLLLTTFNVRDYLSGEVLTEGVWQHVAVHLNSANDAQFYVNGKLVATDLHNAPALADSDDRLIIGATTEVGQQGTSQRFNGAIDSVAVMTGAPDEEAWVALLGAQPLLHLPFDERNVVAYDYVADVSGLQAAVEYRPYTSDDVGNHAIVGHVGRGAIELTPLSDRVYIDTQMGIIPQGDESFTIALWVRDMGRMDLNVGPDFQLQFSSGSVTTNLPGHSFTTPAGGTSGWHHYAFTYAGDGVGAYNVYKDGLPLALYSVIGGANLAPDIDYATIVHQSASQTFALDDLRLYRRALEPAELMMLNNLAWQDAALTARGPNAEETTWSATLPADTEGFYNVVVRGGDTVGNVDEEPQAAWSGMIDTLAPTLIITDDDPGQAGFEYTFEFSDFALKESTLTLPDACSGKTEETQRVINRAPWVLAVGDQTGTTYELLTAITIVCRPDAALAPTDTVTACDLAANCTVLQIDGTAVPTAVTVSTLAQAQPLVGALALTLLAALLTLAAGWFVRRRRF